MIFFRVSSVMYFVGNCMKCVIVIVVMLLYFKNLVFLFNMVGIVLVLSGVFLYSRVKRVEGDKKKAAAATSVFI